jgi:dihydroneopterin aldolase
MITIEVAGAEFFAKHGFYAEEQLLGNKFVVDIAVDFLEKGTFGDKIINTVNYEQLYDIAAEEMQLTKKLLESVAESIMTRIKSKYAFILAARVSIRKLNPPIRGKVAYSAVTLSYYKNEI